MKYISIILLISLIFMTSFSFAQSREPYFITIQNKGVILYERPTTSSPVARRVFAGEILKILDVLSAEHGETWGKVYLSPNLVAYIEGTSLGNSSTPPQEVWKPQEVLRSQMPISFAAKGTSELFGPGLQLRYLPLTRLGITLGAGSILDSGSSKGFSVAYGLTCILSMANFSPFIEAGTSVLTLNDVHSALRVSAFYVNMGVEWMLRSGYFFGAGISYSRSYNIQVAYDYSFAKASNGNMRIGDYGSFSSLSSSESLERLNPLFTVGYSF